MGYVGRKPTLRAPRLLSIAFDQEQWRAIEANQRNRRISTTTETIRALIWRGLEAEGAGSTTCTGATPETQQFAMSGQDPSPGAHVALGATRFRLAGSQR